MKWFYLLTAALVFGGCTKRVLVPVETHSVVTDTVKLVTSEIDTMVWRDSVVIIQKGDTIAREIWHTREKIKWRGTDSSRSHRDTVVREVPVEVEKIVEKPIGKSPGLKTRMKYWGEGLIVAVAMIIIGLIIKRKRK